MLGSHFKERNHYEKSKNKKVPNIPWEYIHSQYESWIKGAEHCFVQPYLGTCPLGKANFLVFLYMTTKCYKYCFRDMSYLLFHCLKIIQCPRFKVAKVYFDSKFVEASVQSHLVPRQCAMEEVNSRGETVQDRTCTKNWKFESSMSNLVI